MTPAARSIYVFGIYLIILGGMLIGSPNTLFSLLQLPPTTEPWAHILGVPIMALGFYHMTSARAELVPFFRASVWIRAFVPVILTVMAIMGIVPPIIVGFGIIDAAFGLWTHLGLKQQATLTKAEVA